MEEEQHQNVKLLSISDLLRQSHLLTATSSLQSFTPRHLYSLKSQPRTRQSQNPSLNPKFLTPLSDPAVLVGTMTLPTTHETSSTTPQCPNNNTCFRFADSTCAVCCDMIDFRVSVLGKRIRVEAFNFIPFKHDGGFLEIIKWRFVDFNDGIGYSSRVGSVPLFDASFCDEKDCHKARYSVWGVVGSVSPVSVIPCSGQISSTTDNASSIKGFLVEFMTCECELCNSVNAWKKVVDNLVNFNESCHSFSRPVFVYFCGEPSSCWHPAMTKLIGNVIALSGLRKKLIFLGKDESQLMFVTSQKSLLHYVWNCKKWLPKGKKGLEGNGECGIYTGIIKGVYMRGMVVELDNEVWLLLTDKQFLLPHSVRIGSIVSVANIHFVRTKFSKTKLLILGGCLKTSIIIESFSPFETRCNVIPRTHSLLEDFISKLSYPARLWVLLTVSCFLRKFIGILTEKEILGSKNKKGLSQIYANSNLPPSAFRPRHGLFKEFCAHASCGCGLESYSGDLRLVVPISIFFQYCELTWARMSLGLENISQIPGDCSKCGQIPSWEEGSHCSSVRKVIRSEEIGVVLSGNLKICPSSGRLQLGDVTGGVDILIPYLQPTWNTSCIYEVRDYHIIMEGRPYPAVGVKPLDDDLYSCRRILNFIIPKRDTSLNVVVYFQSRNIPCRNFSLHSCEDREGSKFEPGSWMLHILRVTHKFPVLHKLPGDAVKSKMSSMCVEATVLPWNLFIDVKDELNHFPATKPTVEASKCWGRNWKFSSNKRFKVDGKPNSTCMSNVSVNKHNKLCGMGSCEIPCLVTITGINKCKAVHSGVLCSKEANTKTAHEHDCKPSLCKILLEFESSNAFNFQMMHIGAYYVIEHLREDCFCKFENSACISGVKILTTSRTKLYGLRFFAGDDIIKSSFNESELGTLDSGINYVKLNETKKNHSEVCGMSSLAAFPEIHLHVSSHVMCHLEADLLESDRVFTEPTVNSEEVATFSPCSGISEMPCPSPVLNSSVYLFPTGNLISIRGDVVGVHGLSTQVSSSGNYLRRNICGDSNSISIYLLMGSRPVKIVGSVRKCALPVGFGPGINATFYRILELSMQKMFMLTPASFVVTNSLMLTNNLCDVKLSVQPESNDAAASITTPGFISGLKQYTESILVHFRCRIVALHTLILEEGVRLPKCLHSGSCCRSPIVEIPLAGFTVEDGSSSCFCWAKAEQAATLLRLHEKLPQTALKSEHWTIKWIKMDHNGHGTSACYLNKVLKKHKKIVMKNFGSMVDSSLEDLTISLGTENNLSNIEEDLLKYIVLNACSSVYWIIVGARLDPVAVHDLKKQHFLEMDMESDSFQHILVREIRSIGPLEEARRTVQKLLKGQTG